jgi:hypothetical protein
VHIESAPDTCDLLIHSYSRETGRFVVGRGMSPKTAPAGAGGPKPSTTAAKTSKPTSSAKSAPAKAPATATKKTAAQTASAAPAKSKSATSKAQEHPAPAATPEQVNSPLHIHVGDIMVSTGHASTMFLCLLANIIPICSFVSEEKTFPKKNRKRQGRKPNISQQSL